MRSWSRIGLAAWTCFPLACGGAPAPTRSATISAPPESSDASFAAPSQHGATTVAAATPEDAWRALLVAMRDGKPLEPWATPAGITSLEAHVIGEPRATAFARWGSGWAAPAWGIRWRARTADRAEAVAGPESKEHGLTFVRSAEGWKLDRWQPGE